jgi:predicted DNA-binding transcriptional regulator YafY
MFVGYESIPDIQCHVWTDILKNVRADRLLAITLLLQARGGMSAPELAGHLEVSTRTIYRDVEALSTAGIPVYVERGAQGGIRLLDGYHTDLTGLSPGEAEALFLMGIPGPLDELGLAPEMDAARRKLLAALPQARRPLAQRLRHRVHVDTVGWDKAPVHTSHLVTIAQAVLTERRITMVYVRGDDNREVRRTVDPLGVVLKAGIWYLVAISSKYDLVFRISRVRSVTVLDQPARRPHDFDLPAYWAHWLKDLESRRGGVAVRIRVDAVVAAELPRHLGEAVRSQVLDAAPSAAGQLELDLVFDSIQEARMSLLGLGAAMEVLSPVELRAEMARAAREVLTVYTDETDGARAPAHQPA